jgi:glyoxylase-like metal-dependent hydrolase (beta-lactamase superfamily II)
LCWPSLVVNLSFVGRTQDIVWEGHPMNRRIAVALLCGLVLCLAAWVGTQGDAKSAVADDWTEVALGILRTKDMPYGYAIVADGHALLIDAPHPSDGLKNRGVKTIDGVLLTHHHRDSVAAVESFLNAKVPVRASKLSAGWMTPENVKKFWKEMLPLQGSRSAYFVLPVGVEGIDFSLSDGQKIDWRGNQIEVIATPGHSIDHLAFALARGKETATIVFSGDAIAEPGKLWAPFTTDWDHWTDLGLKPTHESLRKLAARSPKALYPAHGQPIVNHAAKVLEETAKAVEEVGFLKSFKRFTDRLGNAPNYPFLVDKQQVASAGDRPWSKVSDHLFITGNTYVLVSKQEKAFLVIDPFRQRSIDQIAKLKKDEGLGTLEVIWFSHAHYDHYDGIYVLPDREKVKVWTLDRVAEAIADPTRLRAPFIDARPVKIDRLFKDGDTAMWREYSFRFHHFPGQTEFTMAVETTIDGKKCLFTADNFFHQDQFSGSGGWMGLNRSLPLPYAASARKVLDVAPEWVLAEHGGPFEFHAEDFKRRVKWGEAAAKAADAISMSGNHRRDWNPHRITIEPIIFKTKSGATLRATLRASNPGTKTERVTIALQGRNLTADQSWALDVPARKTIEKNVTLVLNPQIPQGRHILILRSSDPLGVEPVDAIVALDVE